ncbi:MAG: class I SAM-dependent methyltransferase [Ignavibacteriaceae bacterium]
MANFKDNFSKQSNEYLKYRPTYPIELFEYLSSLTKGHELAWDCGTGNGQAALSLTNYYKKVIATDPSEQQIKNAAIHPKITYKIERAEHTDLKENSVDLITVAQAIHWFNFDEFYAEAKRVLKSNGIIAVWTYALPLISKEIDEIVKDFHDNIVGEFWQYENQLVIEEYAAVPFPFPQLSTPIFKIQKNLSLNDLLGFVNTWSALQRFIDAKGYNPIAKLEEKLSKFWSNADEEKVTDWRIILKVGRNIK